MVTHITTNQTATYTAVTSGETVVLDANVRISATSQGFDDTSAANNLTFEVGGTILAGSAADGIFSQSANSHFIVDESGIIIAGYGIALVNDAPADVSNAGYIGGSIQGIYIASNSGNITNTGSIIGSSYGIYLVASAIRADFDIDSNGLIAAATGINMDAQHGTITLGADSRLMATVTGILNSGAAMTLTNAGVISASAGTAYQGSVGVDHVTNTGRIVGDVLLGAGADIFRQSGTGSVVGDIAGGADSDLYILSSNKMRVEEMDGGGVDSIRASATYSLVGEGEIENLTLKAKANATGNEYHNVLKGNAGDNHLDGGFGPDSLTGGKGHASSSSPRAAPTTRSPISPMVRTISGSSVSTVSKPSRIW